MALGLVFFNTNLTTGNGFRDEESSTRGQDLVARAFPAGANVPNTVIVPNPKQADDVRAALAAAGGREPRAGRDRPARCPLRPDPARRPLLDRGFDQIPGCATRAEQAGGEGVLIGGPTAEERDLRESAERDTWVIMPLVLSSCSSCWRSCCARWCCRCS